MKIENDIFREMVFASSSEDAYVFAFKLAVALGGVIEIVFAIVDHYYKDVPVFVFAGLAVAMLASVPFLKSDYERFQAVCRSEGVAVTSACAHSPNRWQRIFSYTDEVRLVKGVRFFRWLGGYEIISITRESGKKEYIEIRLPPVEFQSFWACMAERAEFLTRR